MKNLKIYIDRKLLKTHSATEREIGELFKVARRDFNEVGAGL